MTVGLHLPNDRRQGMESVLRLGAVLDIQSVDVKVKM
jgi:hypothetical protein